MLVDFSSKHDILIHHKDGSYSPMDEPYYEVTRIDETTWQIMSSGDYHYLLACEDEAIAIDTGYSAGNLREFLEKLCGKPVRSVINTHHHFDHSANNCYFEKAYMAAEAVPLVSIPYKSFAGMDFFPDSYEKVVVEDGETIPLKGRELQIFRIGDHTKDGIVILDRKNKYLFSGDEFMPHGKSVRGSVWEWNRNLKKIAQYRDEFTMLYGGPGAFPAEVFDIFNEAAELMSEGMETVPPPEEEGHPSLKQPDHDGHKVYDCQCPHIEDIPKGGFFAGAKNRTLIYKNYKFEYNKEE